MELTALRQIRESVLRHVKTDDATLEQMDAPLEGIVSSLSSDLGRTVTVEDVASAVYDSEVIRGFNDRAWHVSQVIRREEESITRLSKMLSRPVLEMSAAEMEKEAFNMFTLTGEQYVNLAKRAGIDLGEKYWSEHRLDGTILFGILEKIHGIRITGKTLTDRLVQMDFGLGYFQSMAALQLQERVEQAEKYPDMYRSGARSIFELLGSIRHEEGGNLEKHLQVEGQLTAKHKIPAPQLLTDKTIVLDMIPYAIAFTPEGKLVVMGGKNFEDDIEEDLEEDVERNSILELYDTISGKRIVHTDTELPAMLWGTPGGASFDGSLSVGSNGILYAVGKGKMARYDSSLQLIQGNNDGFLDCVEAIKKRREGLWWVGGNRLTQVTEADGVHYFAYFDPKMRESDRLLAMKGKDVTGIIRDYHTTSGITSGAFGHQQRFVVHDEKVYIKMHSNIVAIDRELGENSRESASRLFNKGDLMDMCIPSNHCIDSKGRLWAVTQTPEEVVSSIKAYEIKDKKAEFLTHAYPENHPGGWPANRSMAISPDGLLAYSDEIGNKIHVYKIE